MWSNRLCLLSEMWSRPPPNVFFYQILKPPRGPGSSGRISSFWTWFPQAAAPGGLLMEGLVPSQMKLDRISTNCLLKTVRTVLHHDRKSFHR